MACTVHIYSERVRERALDLCACDGQMWGNVPRSIRRAYLEEACAEIADEETQEALAA